MKNKAPTTLSYDEAIKLLPNSDEIHTFRNPAPNVLFGADWTRDRVITALKTSKEILLGGEQCMAMKHGLVIEDEKGYVFIESVIHEELDRTEKGGENVS